jgi:hypothetical protein
VVEGRYEVDHEILENKIEIEVIPISERKGYSLRNYLKSLFVGPSQSENEPFYFKTFQSFDQILI